MAIQNNGYILYDTDKKAMLSYTRVSVLEKGEIHSIGSPFEISVARSGGTVVLNGVMHYINSGDIIVFSENETVFADKVSNSITFDKICIYPTLATRLNSITPYLNNINFFKSHSDKFFSIIPHYENTARQISELMLSIDYELSEQNKTSYLTVFQELFLIIKEIAENTEYPSPLSDTKEILRPKHKAISVIKEYLNNHISEDISLKKLASVSGLSPNYLSNVFKEQTGVVLWDYINSNRIENAKKLLEENPSDSILSVALKCGFNNCPNFNRVFKQYTGLTPGKYRKSLY